MAQPFEVTCSTVSFSSQENGFFSFQFLSGPLCWDPELDAASRYRLLCATQRGTIPSLDCQAVPLFILPRSCRMALLPSHTSYHHLLQVIDKDVEADRSLDRPLQFSIRQLSLGRLQSSLSLTIQPASHPSSLVVHQSSLFLCHFSVYCVYC